MDQMKFYLKPSLDPLSGETFTFLSKYVYYIFSIPDLSVEKIPAESYKESYVQLFSSFIKILIILSFT